MNWAYHIRRCFVAEPGYILIGCDMDNIELRVTAHYTSFFDGGEYANQVLNGDQHQITADALGITRDKAKAVNFAVTYGAGSKRISNIVGISERKGGELVKRFWDSKPGLKMLKENLENSLVRRGVDLKQDLVKQRAYIDVLGNRRVYVRQVNSLLNCLIQASATVLFKEWYNAVAFKLRDMDARIVLNHHDELLCQCREGDIDKVKKILEEGLIKLRDKFNLKVDITGTAVAGSNWYEVHT